MKQDHDDKLNKTSAPTGDKKAANDAEHPWQKKFMDDRDDTGNLSRVATRHRDKNMTSFAVVLAIILALLMIIPMGYWAFNMRSGNGSSSANKITVTQSEKDSTSAAASSRVAASSRARAKKEAAASRKASEAAENNTTAVSSSSAAASSSSTEQQSAPTQTQDNSNQQAAASSSAAQTQQPAAQSSSAPAQASSSTPAVTAGGSYTVKAGDNPFRIALNHGMSLSELYALNPSVQSGGIIPGQVLKVK